MISAICPIKNEANYLPIHIENLIDKVDEIVYCDTGCEDKSIEIINSYKEKYGDKIKLITWKVDNPYSWQEGKIRQYLVDSAKNNIILHTDADEVLSDNFVSEIEKHKNNWNGKLILFSYLPLWKNIKTIRCNVPEDAHWYPNPIYRMFDKRQYLYEEKGNHSFLKSVDGTPEKTIFIKSIKLFHLHYALFKRCKPNDNRLCDFGLLDYWEKNTLPDNIPDELFDSLPHTAYSLKTIQYTGEYPACLKNY